MLPHIVVGIKTPSNRTLFYTGFCLGRAPRHAGQRARAAGAERRAGCACAAPAARAARAARTARPQAMSTHTNHNQIYFI